MLREGGECRTDPTFGGLSAETSGVSSIECVSVHAINGLAKRFYMGVVVHQLGITLTCRTKRLVNHLLPLSHHALITSHHPPPQSSKLLFGSQSPSAINSSRQDFSELGRVVTSSSSTQGALGSRHENPPFSPQVKSSVLTQVHSQQSPPSKPENRR